MTLPITANYALAAEKVATSEWVVDAATGVVYGVRRRPFTRRNTHGYIQIKFRHPDDWTREVSVLAHRVVWESEHGPVDPGLEINHRNGDKTDNRLSNLEAITHIANVQHGRDTGLTVPLHGEAHPCAVITAEDARTIYSRAWAGETMASIARDYPVGRSMVGNIKCGLAWVQATGHVG